MLRITMLNSLLPDDVRNNAGQTPKVLLLAVSEPLSREGFVQLRKSVRCGKCCTTLLHAESCGAIRIRNILKHNQ